MIEQCDVFHTPCPAYFELIYRLSIFRGYVCQFPKMGANAFERLFSSDVLILRP